MSRATDASKPARPIRVMPPVYFFGGIVSMAALHALLPGMVLLARPWNWLGLAPLAGGLLLGGLAAWLFARHKTTIKPGHVSTSLLTSGPYRRTRNPIYLGMTIALAGVALLLGSLTPWPVLPVFVGLIAWNVIPVEEAMMGETFGAEYEQYRARVRRWI